MSENPDNNQDINLNHDKEVLIQKIQFLEEELVRKDFAIEKLRQENDILFRSMLKSKESNSTNK